MEVTDKIEVKLLNTIKNREQINNPFTAFLIHAPVFAVREFLKYVPAGVSVFEFSNSIEPDFFMPAQERGIVNVGDEMLPGEPRDYGIVHQRLTEAYEVCWTVFKNLIEYGIVEEVARMALPLSYYISVQVTGDFHSLSLLTDSGSSLKEADFIIKEIKQRMNEMRK